ncbi:MAG: biotin/lipoyl-containing protein [Chloroflexota bacterium]
MTDAANGQHGSPSTSATSSSAGQGKPLASTTYRVEAGGQTLSVAVVEREDGLYVQVGDGPERRVEVAVSLDDGELGAIVGGQLVHGMVTSHEGGLTVSLDGQTTDVTVMDERAARLASAASAGRPGAGQTTVSAPMPGLVVAVPVGVGQAVTRGTTLVVLSAMKMQNELTAPADATVKEVLVEAGQTVDKNQALVRLG